MNAKKKIHLLCNLLSQLCILGLVCLPLLQVWIWIDVGRLVDALSNLEGHIIPQELAPLNRGIGFLLGMMPISFLMVGLVKLRDLCLLLKKNYQFEKQHLNLLHTFTLMLLYGSFIAPITRALISIVVTINNPAGQRALVVNLDSEDLIRIFLAAVLLLIIWSLNETHHNTRPASHD
jgi:hypothetical protein